MAIGANAGPDDVETEWWREAIVAALTSAQPVIEVRTPMKRTGGNSRPALVIGSDGRRYVIKGLQAGRAMGRRLFADHLVGRLGAIVGAPVAEVALVSLPFEIADGSFATMHLQPGLVHGSVFIPDVIDGWWGFEHLDVLENRRRFAQLAILFGWVGADDHQFVYRTSPPELVYSCDHDYFLPGAPNWSSSALASAGTAEPDRYIVDGAFLADSDVAAATGSLDGIRPRTIAQSVAKPPETWGVDLDDRIALAVYLEPRRRQLLAWARAHR